MSSVTVHNVRVRAVAVCGAFSKVRATSIEPGVRLDKTKTTTTTTTTKSKTKKTTPRIMNGTHGSCLQRLAHALCESQLHPACCISRQVACLKFRATTSARSLHCWGMQPCSWHWRRLVVPSAGVRSCLGSTGTDSAPCCKHARGVDNQHDIECAAGSHARIDAAVLNVH